MTCSIIGKVALPKQCRAAGVCWDPARPVDNSWHPMSSFPGGPFC